MSEAAEPIVVEVNADFEELIPGFLANRARELAELQEALAQGDFARFCAIGHRLKGVAGSYGFSVLTPLAVAFEQGGKAQSPEDCARVIEEYARILPRLQVVFVEADA